MSVRNEEVAKLLGTKTHELNEMEKIQRKKNSNLCTHIHKLKDTNTE
jgi:hypothetical protein